jgi:GrpB-like predicted nucleotidyltransferase (UPF0157 family)
MVMADEPSFRLAPDTDAARRDAERLFADVHALLRRHLPAAADIRHIGATAIPGCLTKGDLDIVVRVPADDFARADASLAALFPRNAGSMRSDTFSAFEDAAQAPPLGVQLAVIGSPTDFFHLFVEAMRHSPDLVAQYNALKRSHDGKDMAVYRKAKDRFVEAVLAGGKASAP